MEERRARGRGDRWFHGGAAVLFVLLVFAGFAPTFYLKGAFHGGPLSPLLLVHGCVFSAWVALYLVQTTLVARAKVAVHRRLGLASAALVAAMLPLGVAVALGSARHAGTPEALGFLAIPLGDLSTFLLFFLLGYRFRRDLEAHKRLMLLATASMMGPAIARLPLPAMSPLIFYGGLDLFLLAGVVHDLALRRRVHRAYLWGGALLLLIQMGLTALTGSGAWMRAARWLVA